MYISKFFLLSLSSLVLLLLFLCLLLLSWHSSIQVPSSTYSLDSRNDRLNEWLNDTAQESNSANQHRIE